MEENRVQFPNTFELEAEELENVKKIMDAYTSLDLSATPAEIITAQMAMICTTFHMMYDQNGTSKADMLYVLNNMQRDMKQFINGL